MVLLGSYDYFTTLPRLVALDQGKSDQYRTTTNTKKITYLGPFTNMSHCIPSMISNYIYQNMCPFSNFYTAEVRDWINNSLHTLLGIGLHIYARKSNHVSKMSDLLYFSRKRGMYSVILYFVSRNKW